MNINLRIIPRIFFLLPFRFKRYRSLLSLCGLWISLIFLLTAITACHETPLDSRLERTVIKNWEFRKARDTNWMPAMVPGSIITDLLRNKKIANPYTENDSSLYQEVDKSDWEYRTQFDADDNLLSCKDIRLIFEGLDTYAGVYLNDTLLFNADNMFRKWSVPCRHLLKKGTNYLKIYFHSTVNMGLKKRRKTGYALPSGECTSESEKSSPYTRKASFQFGSKISPRLISSGIWKPVILMAVKQPIIDNVYFYPKTVSEKNARYEAVITFQSNNAEMADLEILLDQKPLKRVKQLQLRQGKSIYKFSFSISNPKLWWPNGLGDPYLYRFKVRLKQSEHLIQENEYNLGVRKIEFVADEDSSKYGCYFKINGYPLFLKGAAYIPSNVLVTQISHEHKRQLIAQVKNANMNILRIWGGGIYESDDFYDLCDQNGILVWQDFMFPNGFQPGNRNHLENIREEIIDNIKRLRNHACLALWCGNGDTPAFNDPENSLPEKIVEKVLNNKRIIFSEMLPAIVRKYDPQTKYIPYEQALLNDKSWNKNTKERSLSEWDYNAALICNGKVPPSYPTLKTVLSDRPSNISGVTVNPAENLMNKLLTGCGNTLPVLDTTVFPSVAGRNPSDIQSFIYFSQVSQAEKLKKITGWLRQNRTMFSVPCFMDDCWPEVSSSLIDFSGRAKPAYYTIRDEYAQVQVVSDIQNNHLSIFGINDQLKTNESILLCKVMDFSGRDYFVRQIPVKINPLSSSLLLSFDLNNILSGLDKSDVCMMVQLSQPGQIIAQKMVYFVPYNRLKLSKTNVYRDINDTGNGFNLILKSDVLAKNVVFDTKNKNAIFSDNNLDLLPNKRYRIHIQYNGTREELIDDLIIKTLNDYL